jgi:hypothetical protein
MGLRWPLKRSHRHRRAPAFVAALVVVVSSAAALAVPASAQVTPDAQFPGPDRLA